MCFHVYVVYQKSIHTNPIGTAMLYQKSIDFWDSIKLYQKSIDFWDSINCTKSRSTFGTALTVPKVDRLLGQPLSLYQSSIGTGLFPDLSPRYW